MGGGDNVSLLWQFAVPIVASFVGLAVWRYQMIGKRRYDVAEEVLDAAHAAVVCLHQIRRARAQADLFASANPDALRADQVMVTHTPLQAASLCFQQLDAKANAITWHFGQKAAQPLIDLQAVYRRLWEAQSGLFYGHPADRRYATADQKHQREEWERALVEQPDDDPLTREIDALGQSVTVYFGKYLRPPIWRVLFPFWG
jgi:hypothetical protein